MEHRKENHEMPLCRDDIKGDCSRGPEQCWYKHKVGQTPSISKQNIINCFSCQQEFRSIGIMMEHRKSVHPETVKLCSKAASGECKRVKCWFLHADEIVDQGFQDSRESQETP